MRNIRCKLIECIHRSPAQLCACVCGPASSAICSLTKVSGCSQTLLYAETINSFLTVSHALGYTPKTVLSQGVAGQLAQHAFRHSQTFISSMVSAAARSVLLLGLGATSALQATFPSLGKDRFYMSIWSSHAFFLSKEEPASLEQAVECTKTSPAVSVREYYLELPVSCDRREQDEYIELFILYNIGKIIQEECPTDIELDSTIRMLASRSFDEDMITAAFLPFKVDEMALLKSHISARDPITEAIQFVLDGKTNSLIFNEFGEIRCNVAPYATEDSFVSGTIGNHPPFQRKRARFLLPGSFCPLHYGHTELAHAALCAFAGRRREEKITCKYTRERCEDSLFFSDANGMLWDGISQPPGQVTYEISVNILDKGKISCHDLASRVRQFLQRGHRVAVTTASRFTEKALLFPDHGFIVGVDTARRILDPQYYEGQDVVQILLRGIGDLGCYFVVGGRTIKQRKDAKQGECMKWEDLDSLTIPDDLRHLFIGLSESEFHVDISSTELRGRLDTPEISKG